MSATHSPPSGGLRRAWRSSISAAAAALLAAGMMVACGGGTSNTTTAIRSAALSAPAGVDTGMLMLLVPDGTDSSDQRVAAWVDAAQETGVRLAPVTDSDFMAMGSEALKFGGLVLPDTLHSVASNEVIAAVRSYVNGGGRALLAFDFGALYESGGNVFYAAGKSRLSDLAGVDYVLYDQLLDRTTGLGPVTAMRSTMRLLQVPPGKSMAYTASTALASSAPIVQNVRYLPVSTTDPGGLRNFDFQQYSNTRLPTAQQRSQHTIRAGGAVDFGRSRQAPRIGNATQQDPDSSVDAGGNPLGTLLAARKPPASSSDVLDAYSGYYYGYLSYPSYVTQGTFAGTVLATSPSFGLVAGVNTVGAGKVLFVNLPLTYLKGQTDALPMHGFLSYFVRQMSNGATLSPMPDGVAGMVFNWHFDAKDAQDPALQLERRGVFTADHLFSIHTTAGPDTVNIGDGLGWDLDHNPTAQALLKRLSATGHDVGSHGGWIHDYYGLYASETNQSDFQQYLVLNTASVNSVIGKAARSYAAPEGNNPTWAMTWLEQQGVVGAYFMGHTGLGVTRQYRNGALLNPNLRVVPLTPFGIYATFEEFQDFAVPQKNVIDWYHSLVDFTIAQGTNRMVYAHPPGAWTWYKVLSDLLTYAQSKGTGSFRWYTMAQLADFAARRAQVNWSEDVVNGVSVITASHPTGLEGMAWRLPKSAYQMPQVTSGVANVTDKGTYWQVNPTGTSVTLSAGHP